MKIRGAILHERGRPAPYARSTPIEVAEVELDPPEGGELLVRIDAAGVCHSDLSVVDGNRPRPVPMLLGHEASGVVEAVGDGVADIAVGDRVVLTFLPRCGDCPGCRTEGRLPCERGSSANAAGTLLGGGVRLHRNGQPVAHHLGASAFATHAVVSRASVVKVESDVPAEIAALLGCAVLTGGGAVVNAAQPDPGAPVVVVGLGGVGLAALLVARALGHPVVGVDALQVKRDAAVALGAESALAPDEAVAAGVRAGAVVEAAGSASAFETAFALTAPGGRTVTVGLPHPDARSQISPLALTTEARTVVGSYLGSSVPARDVPMYVELWRQGRLPLDRLISDVVALGQINEAMDALAEGRALRQILDVGR